MARSEYRHWTLTGLIYRHVDTDTSMSVSISLLYSFIFTSPFSRSQSELKCCFCFSPRQQLFQHFTVNGDSGNPWNRLSSWTARLLRLRFPSRLHSSSLLYEPLPKIQVRSVWQPCWVAGQRGDKDTHTLPLGSRAEGVDWEEGQRHGGCKAVYPEADVWRQLVRGNCSASH